MSAATRVFRRLLATQRGAAAGAAGAGAMKANKGANGNELKAIKVDNSGRAWRFRVQIGRGEGLLANLHPRDAPLLERTGSFGDTPATMTTRPVSLPPGRTSTPPSELNIFVFPLGRDDDDAARDGDGDGDGDGGGTPR
jgi:hypothetical protein